MPESETKQIASRGWRSMDGAPKGRTVKVELPSGERLEAHFAQDLSGEDQPPFSGWFKQRSKSHPEYGFVQIDTPIAWKEIRRSDPAGG